LAYFWNEHMKLSEKVAIVTGAAQGIGLATATAMAEAGARVMLVDRNATSVSAAADNLAARGLMVRSSGVDITSLSGNRQMAEETLDVFGRIDIFHANAGVAPFRDVLTSSEADVTNTIDVNLVGAIHGCATVLPVMTSQRQGVILLTASIAAFVGDPSVPVYSATKGGLVALCKSLAVRHGPDGIRCNTICPGDVATAMLEGYLASESDQAAARRELASRYPLRRLAEPADIAKLAVFLCSDDAAWITGADYVIDGGLTARCY
jgi:NAD(P)-dependent dehydrogenase (short-subunit alcohol dehydrogenase family)